MTCIDFIGTCIKVQSEYKKQINTHTALYIRFKIVLGILKELISIKYVNNKIMFIFLWRINRRSFNFNMWLLNVINKQILIF